MHEIATSCPAAARRTASWPACPEYPVSAPSPGGALE